MLSKVYQPKKVERRIYTLWQKSGFFNPDKLPKRHKKPFTIVLPPPNITGSLHMGHALNAVIQDILIRQKRMEGFKTLWLPGTDHAGIATQNVVEKELKKEGKTRFDLGRKKLIERIWQWKEKYGDIILDQLKKLGASCDWSRTRFTLDEEYSKAVKRVFNHYYKKGWIYRGKRVVNWCQRCATSLSDLELEYKQEKGMLWYIRYFLKDKTLSKKYITVATTRPETMLGDTAIAVNPKDKRYKSLIGKKAILPLVNREIPIVANNLVNPEFGTGAVKVTPAHDLKDHRIALEHKLPIIQVIDEEGKITKEAPSPYQGLTVERGREKVIANLKELGLITKSDTHFHQVPYCYRCNSKMEFLPSEQWFLKMDKLAKKAMAPVKKGKIKFHFMLRSGIDTSHFGCLRNSANSYTLSSNSSSYARTLCYCHDFRESRRHDALHALIDLVDSPEERLKSLDPLEVGDSHAASVAQYIRDDECAVVFQDFVCFWSCRSIGSFSDNPSLDSISVVCSDLVFESTGGEDIAIECQELIIRYCITA